MGLLAIEDVKQLLAIQPRTRGTLAGELGHQRKKFRCRSRLIGVSCTECSPTAPAGRIGCQRRNSPELSVIVSFHQNRRPPQTMGT
jgi:hypothetical protein